MKVKIHQKETYTIVELDFPVMWLQTPLKKDKISALGGGYNDSIVILSDTIYSGSVDSPEWWYN